MAPRYESLMNSELNRFWGIDYKAFVSRLLDDYFPRDNDTILDIATGTAFIPALFFEKRLKFNKVVGLDITYGMLLRGKERLVNSGHDNSAPLVCASALLMPFQREAFDHAICCLATHHMDADTLLTNMHHSLKTGGWLRIADAGASSKWKNKFIQLIIKIAAFLYFLFSENISRALAESAAIGNIHTSKEWEEMIKSHGFVDISIEQLRSKHFWAPNPLFIKAIKNP